MPSEPKRMCYVAGHPSYVGRRCPRCNQEYDLRRGGPRKRGYDREWEAFRKDFLMRHPICEFMDCQEKATDVHHLKRVKDFPELKLINSNCKALCHSHHSYITGVEDIGKGKVG